MTAPGIAADLRAEAAKRARHASSLVGEKRARAFGYAAGLRDAAVFMEQGKVVMGPSGASAPRRARPSD